MHTTDLGLNLSLMNQILPCMQASNQRRIFFKEVFWVREKDTTRWERGLGQWSLINSEEELCCFLDLGACGKCNQTHPHLQAKWDVLIQEYLHQIVICLETPTRDLMQNILVNQNLYEMKEILKQMNCRIWTCNQAHKFNPME